MLLLLFSFGFTQDLEFNYYTQEWEYIDEVEETYTNQYDYFINSWKLLPSDPISKYNFELGRYELQPRDVEWSYDFMNSKWDFIPKNSTPVYNSMEGRWEYVRR